MKTKEFQKLRELSVEELQAREKELKEELFNLRFQQATGQLANPMRLKECKRDIARVKTVLNARLAAN
ncbi:MAG: 50S ribosomal protein L29 [Clostridia bacterium]|jgi:large subunit ribosomal protein L29|nr:50S ribosomal protein L29 [Clostridia bacterium]